MIKNFFKAISLGMKWLGKAIIDIFLTYLGCFVLPTLGLLFVLKADSNLDGFCFLMLMLVLCYLNVEIFSFFNHCVDACKYAEKNKVDIKEAFKATRSIDNSDDPF